MKQFEGLEIKIKELKKDPRDLIDKLIALSYIDIKEAFKAIKEEISETDLPEKIYSADQIHEFYFSVATSKFGDPFEVIETLEKALAMTKRSNDPKIIAEKANILYYLGAAKITIEELKSAEETLKKGLEVSKQIHNEELAQRIQRILNSLLEYY